uniref:DUF6570 domain-containing protein n=1 Tax=Clytia hemisphaerica TaxID=252671 RepID=A0A7M5WQX0_9CNID
MGNESAHFEIQFVQICSLREELKNILQQDFSAFLRNCTRKRKNNSGDENHSTKRQKTRKETNKTYYQKNQEVVIENNKIYRSQNKEKINKNNKNYRSQNKEKIHERDKNYRSQNKEKVNEQDKVYYKKNKKVHKDNLVSKFLKLVNEGPFYVCVCCNRCLYRQTVIKYSADKYDMPKENYYSEVVSFDGQLYICKTCHNKLKKGDLPCQSVKNKLSLDELPEEFHTLRRLEKILISRRILFKKIAIMPKGQFPKLKGSICNVPINVENVANTLPRSTSDNGLLIVKLKRKLEYRGHVVFEPIRPDFIQ